MWLKHKIIKSSIFTGKGKEFDMVGVLRFMEENGQGGAQRWGWDADLAGFPFIHQGIKALLLSLGDGGGSQSYWSNRFHFGLERYSADCERVDCRGRSRKTSVSTVLRKHDLWPWNSGNKGQRAWAAFSASWASAVVTSLAKIWESPFDRMDSNKADHMKSHHVSECEAYTLQ